ncbi:MAG: 2-oxoglutarate dehydrogenase complex dihydrolipoyllysine-residue succinyltransferase [Bacteroidetes bacterium]|nr:MAG: 2-oxoglutarate dehydrogenase complex dihydrolipoyllysine-residue succinyltransferase [Bacteroidota bacterium]
MIIEVKVPSPGESITEVEIESWLVESGAYVEMDDELAEINSDKATLTVNAESGGVIELLAAEGDVVAVGQVIAKIDTEAAGGAEPAAKEEAPAKEEPSTQPETVTTGEEGYAKGHPSVSAEKLMKEKGLDPADVQGSGRGGRITKTDVVNHQPKAQPQAQPKAEPKPEPKPEGRPIPAMPTPGGGAERAATREKMSRLRQTISKRLVSVKNETAMLTTFNEVDLYEVMQMRKKYKEKFKETHGVGLGFMSFFTKAVTMALMEFPAVNGQIQGDEIVTFNYADVGIAVSTPRGLVVPVIRNAHLMSLAEIEQAVLHFALKARENKISIPEMEGGTFSITNGGVFGSMLSTPIINPPQAAILGMHNIVERPVAINGEVKIRPVMYVALSYDHRIIDGKEAVSFLFRVKERLEDPARMLLEV